MSLLNNVFKFFLSQRIHDIQRFMENPHEFQHLIFKEIITKAKNTEWGKAHGYHDGLTYHEYRQNVPVSTYEDIYPYIERMLRGEQNVLWPATIDWFSKSSGTTNDRSKFIPVSQEAVDETHHKAGKDMMCLYGYSFPDTKVFTGKSLSIGGTHYTNPYNPQSRVGDVSAIIVEHLPMWVEFIRAPEKEIFFIPKWEDKINKMVETCIDENITSLTGVPTWMIVVINEVLKSQKKTNILEVWPNLELFMHGAVAFGPYKNLFKTLIPSDQFNYLELYNASEGFFGVQDRPYADDMLLMVDHGIFYEFMPLHNIGKPYPDTLTLDRVVINEPYALIITTNAGLYRYMIGDTVKFTSVNPYRIKITGRTKSFINAFGEELVVENADHAIAEACLKTGAVITDYTAAPCYFSTNNNKGGHEWFIEFAKMPNDLLHFTKILDTSLREINSDYDAKRYNDMALQPPKINSVPQNTFYKWLKTKNKLGGQNKVPRLSNDRKIADELLAIV
ncbi:MAG: GH3 auxin-responsive promoter family protein [Cytophagales bacterium]|nr:GH3 auxin-responsive promoter family protein [Cytophagales bacterium]